MPIIYVRFKSKAPIIMPDPFVAKASYGTANAGKVLGIGNDGVITPVEVSSGLAAPKTVTSRISSGMLKRTIESIRPTKYGAIQIGSFDNTMPIIVSKIDNPDEWIKAGIVCHICDATEGTNKVFIGIENYDKVTTPFNITITYW